MEAHKIQHRCLRDSLLRYCEQATEGRDSTHNHEHMNKVCQNAEDIMDHMNEEMTEAERSILYRMVIAVALFHDIADHKYTDTPAEYNQMIAGMRGCLMDLDYGIIDIDAIFDIIRLISFSKEKRYRADKGRVPDWEEVLGSRFNATVRNIVSDADKLEAIGREGIDRCWEFTREHIYRDQDVPDEIIYENVAKHCDDKLFVLPAEENEWFHTERGKERARELMNDMVERLEELKPKKC